MGLIYVWLLCGAWIGVQGSGSGRDQGQVRGTLEEAAAAILVRDGDSLGFGVGEWEIWDVWRRAHVPTSPLLNNSAPLLEASPQPRQGQLCPTTPVRPFVTAFLWQGLVQVCSKVSCAPRGTPRSRGWFWSVWCPAPS